MASHEHIGYLLFKRSQGTLTVEDMNELETWKSESDNNLTLYNELDDEEVLATKLSAYHEDNKKQIRDRIYELIKERQQEEPATPVHRIHFLRTAWFRYAAAILIMVGAGTYLYVANQKEKPSVTQINPLPVENDAQPGSNRATLTLADGRRINLDEAKSGTIATEGKTKISKVENQVIYVSPAGGGGREATGGGPISFNTMSTPRGGQYQLTLPDGTRVWLNAESSITYPTAFNANDRKVSIQGEAYFEVTHNKSKPFKVETATQTLEVLGTKFNINAYKEEPTINTTLLEGSVRLTNNDANKKLSVLTLKPRQQGQLNNNQLTLAANPNIEQVMAWKNGQFNFDNKSFEEVMRMLARWYDVEVFYEGKIPSTRIGGEMGRDLNLSQVLQALAVMGVKYRIESKRLIVTS